MKIQLTKLQGDMVITPSLIEPNPIKQDIFLTKIKTWIEARIKLELDRAKYGQVIDIDIFIDLKQDIGII